MGDSIARPLKYVKSNTGPCTRHVTCFLWFRLLVVELWTNEVLQVTKMVLSQEQCAFIVKQYYEACSLKRILDDFILEFPNSVSPFNNAILNLIKKIFYKRGLNDLQHMGRPSVVTSEKREAIAKNGMEHPTTSSQLVLQVGLSYMSTHHTLHPIAYLSKILIQLELQQADSLKRTKLYQWLFDITHFVMF